MKAEPSSWEMAEHLNLSVDTVVLANRISILALFWLSHYLQWAGFDVQHTTDFKEFSVCAQHPSQDRISPHLRWENLGK